MPYLADVLGGLLFSEGVGEERGDGGDTRRKDFNVEIKLKGLPSSLLIINLIINHYFKNIFVLLPSMGHLLPHYRNIYM